MLIDRSTAVELASTIIASTHGTRSLRTQAPLRTEERDNLWLVRGTPYTDKAAGLQYCFTFFLFNKRSAQVVGLCNVGRAILTEEKRRYWHTIMSDDEFNRVFGPRNEFAPGGEELAQALFFHAVTYGGLINKPEHAIAYAKAVATGSEQYQEYGRTFLSAKLDGDTWSIEDTRRPVTIMTIARRDCSTSFTA